MFMALKGLKGYRAKFVAMLLVGVLVVGLGILIITHSDSFIKIMMIASGIGALCDGLYTLFNIKRWHFASATKTLAIVKGVLTTLVGLAAILVPMFVAQTAMTVLVYAFAICLVFSAFVSFENAAMARSFIPGISTSHFFVEAVVSILVAIILFAKPTAVLTTFAVVVGVIVALLGVGVFVWAFRFLKLAKNATIIEVEATVKDAE